MAGCGHSKIARVARVVFVFVLYVVGRAYKSAVFDCHESRNVTKVVDESRNESPAVTK